MTTLARTLIDWLGTESPVAQAVEKSSRNQLDAYKKHPPLVEEHANIERSIVDGGYGRQQLYELIQNGADELIGERGRIEVVLTESALYCANEGKPISKQGATAILQSHISKKKGVEIGRFGLGFKSVLGVTSNPQIFSKSGSFGFDIAANEKRIQDVLPKEKRVPILRLGTALDPREEARRDAVLAELMSWATTVIRLPRDVSETGWLNRDLREFPAEFLVFSPHVNELVLDDRESGNRRELRLTEVDGDWYELFDGKKSHEWRVSRSIHRPSAKAKKEGGAATERDEVPVYWAVPKTAMRLGEIWAFFPTGDRTTLRGIINAPWKLSDDRTGLLDGLFNLELLEEAAGLVLDQMPEAMASDDPGSVLEIIPARGRETRGWADEQLGELIYDLARTRPSLPDQDGELCLPAELTLHPEDMPERALEAWSKIEWRPKLWCHPTVDTKNRTTRRSRVERLIGEGSGVVADITQWISAIIDPDDLFASSKAALSVSALTLESTEIQAELRSVPMILDSTGALARLDEEIFVPVEADSALTVRLVHPSLVADPAIRRALTILGVPEVSSATVLSAKLADAEVLRQGADWTTIWDLARGCSPEEIWTIFEARGITKDTVSVRALDGSWAHLRDLLQSGPLFNAELTPKVDWGSLIDSDWHAAERTLFERMGVATGPVEGRGSTEEPWFAKYFDSMVDRFNERLKGQNVRPDSLELDGLNVFAGPITPAEWLSDESAAKYLTVAAGQSPALGGVSIQHKTNRKFDPLNVPHPIVWLLQKRGLVLSLSGVVSLSTAVGVGLSDLKEFLPVALLPEEASQAFGLPGSVEELDDDHWKTFLTEVGKLERGDLLSRNYAQAVPWCDAPSTISAQLRDEVVRREPKEVAVVESADDLKILKSTGAPFLAFAEEERDAAQMLIEKWGLRSAESLIRSEVAFISSAEALPIGDLFPMLGSMLDFEQRSYPVQPCAELSVETFTDLGRLSREVDFQFDSKVFYRSDDISDQEFVGQAARAVGIELSSAEIEDVVANAEQAATTELATKLRAAGSDAERLLMVGPAEILKQRLPEELLRAYAEMHGEPDDLAIAKLTLASNGYETLRELRPLFEEKGFTPPQNWAGTKPAVEFVGLLGFERAYAGFKNDDRDESVDVEGPSELPELHDYQKKAADAICETLDGSRGLRGFLSLPTGSGKTRVTVEAFVRAISSGLIPSPVLWIAQSDELCEQAVESWIEVWRANGPPESLRISRLWDKNSPGAAESGHQLVVATPDKLIAACVKDSAYDWLSKAGAVVVDEAHSSTTPSYTKILEWLGMGRGKERAPLIGLSATPFRGNSESETASLAARYGGRRLDLDAFGEDPTIENLQKREILAKIDHQVLDGAEVSLTDDELKELKKFSSMPSSVMRRIGGDVDRNRRLVESIMSLDPEWPVLVFGASVKHAETLAALLQLEGRSAASVFGETPRSTRRHIVEQFRSGEISVLTNYGVLTQGFDAPSIRALYIARPTYSPNLYQQMVGRGLRGPLNGGKEHCLVVNVEDNIKRYGATFAFQEFDHLWTSGK